MDVPMNNSKAYSGFFHLLPLGQRVQEKLERLVDKHMTKLGKSSLDYGLHQLPALLTWRPRSLESFIVFFLNTHFVEKVGALRA